MSPAASRPEKRMIVGTLSPASMSSGTNLGLRGLLRAWIELTGRSPSPLEQIKLLRSKESLELRRFLRKYGKNWILSVGRRCLESSNPPGKELNLTDWVRECRVGLATTAVTPSPPDARRPQRTRQQLAWLPAVQNYDEDA
jgi:hypothetical protein